MFRHVVLFRWKDDATEEEKRDLERAISALPDLLPQIRRYRFGRDAGLMEGNYDFAIVADFDSRDDWRIYWEHPEHVRIIRQWIRPVIAERVAVQYRFVD